MSTQPDKLEATARELLKNNRRFRGDNPPYDAACDTIAALLADRAALQARCEAAEKDAALGAYLRPLITWHHNPALGRQLIGKEICHNYVAELRCWSVGEPNIQQLADAAIAKGAAHE